MHIYPELIPPTTDKLQFPGGDISEEAQMNALVLRDDLSQGSPDEQLFKVNNLIRAGKRRIGFTPQSAELYAGLCDLGQAWGDMLEAEGMGYVPDALKGHFGKDLTSAMFAMQGFIGEARLSIPAAAGSGLAEELTDMTHKNAFAIRAFGEEAWHGMRRSHPRLYAAIAPFQVHFARTIFPDLDELSPDQVLDNPHLYGIEAAMALPYALAVASRMDGYFPRRGDDFNSKLAKLGMGEAASKEE